MPYLLRFTGGASPAGYVSHPAALSGASTFDVELDFVPRSIATGYSAVYSNNSGDSNNRHAMYVWGSSRCEISFIIGGVRRVLNAPVGTFTAGTRYKVNAVYNGSTFSILVNGSSVASVAASGTVGGSGGLVWIGANATETRAAIDLYGYKITQNGTLIRNYDPSGTSSGTTLFDVQSGQDGTQAGTWPSDNSEWVFYSSGAYTLTADGATYSYSGGIASTIYNRLLSADGGSFSYFGGVAATLLNRLIAADGATFGYSGGVSALLYGRALQAAGGSFSYSGGVATFVYTPITGYVLNADGGIFSYAGGEAALSFNQKYPTANPNDYTVSAYLSADSTYTARLSESSTINAIISASSTFNARFN